MKSALRNLTLASAKHLLGQGHISPSQHKRIAKKMKAAPMPEEPLEQPPGSLSPMVAPPMGMLPGLPPEGM